MALYKVNPHSMGHFMAGESHIDLHLAFGTPFRGSSEIPNDIMGLTTYQNMYIIYAMIGLINVDYIIHMGYWKKWHGG